MEEKKITATKLRDYILTQMSAEEALLRILQSHVDHYEKLKVQNEPEHQAGNPIIIAIHAAMDLGWQFLVERGRDAPVRGLTIGTEEYLNDLFKKKE